jgi:type IV secretion system protein VirB9
MNASKHPCGRRALAPMRLVQAALLTFGVWSATSVATPHIKADGLPITSSVISGLVNTASATTNKVPLVTSIQPAVAKANAGTGPTTSTRANTSLSTTPAAAATTGLSRIQRVSTDGETPLLLPLVKGFPSVVELPAGEKILDIAVGGLSDWASAWEIARRESSFYIKPLANAQLTTMLVGTTERTYVIDLQPLPHTADNQASRLSRLILMRPSPPEAVPIAPPAPDPQEQAKAEALQSAQQQVQALEQHIQSVREDRYNKRPRNYDYTMEMASLVEDIRPREVFDDGRFTYFKFPDALQIPAVYRGNAEAADETLVNSHIANDYLVVHGVHTRWVLRLGGSVIGLFNEKFDPQGIGTQSGTSTTETRVLK